MYFFCKANIQKKDHDWSISSHIVKGSVYYRVRGSILLCVSFWTSHTHYKETVSDCVRVCDVRELVCLWLPKTYWDCGFAPLCWRWDRLLQSAAGAWTRTVAWVKRHSIWRDGIAEQLPAQCKLRLAQTAAGPNSSSHGPLQPGSCREEKDSSERRKALQRAKRFTAASNRQTSCWATKKSSHVHQGHPQLLYVF